jgi:hypothetical protein
MTHKRILGLALIALAVPFPALALEGGGAEEPRSQGLTVSASLESCGLADSQIMCKINAGWNSLEGAESYAVSVTSADGSVIDMGETSGQGTSVWVPYAGAGTYSVSVTAWGTPPDEEDDGTPEIIDRSTTMSGGDVDGVAKSPPAQETDDIREDDGAQPTAEDPVIDDGALPEDPRDETPVCEEEPPVSEPRLAPTPESEASPREDAEPAEQLEPEVVDTIPADDDCIG